MGCYNRLQVRPIKQESKKGSWTTVWVDWKRIGDCRSLFYIGKEVRGIFSSQGTPPMEESAISIGGRCEISRGLKGGISALEIYVGS